MTKIPTFTGVPQDIQVPTTYTHTFGMYPSEYSTMGPSRLNNATARFEFTPKEIKPIIVSTDVRLSGVSAASSLDDQKKHKLVSASNLEPEITPIPMTPQNKEHFSLSLGEIDNKTLIIIFLILLSGVGIFMYLDCSCGNKDFTTSAAASSGGGWY
jgi:hypothetical protein